MHLCYKKVYEDEKKGKKFNVSYEKISFPLLGI